MSDSALVAAMRPKSYGSSTIGMKKSVVATTACSSFRRYTAASSLVSIPTSSAGSRNGRGTLARISVSAAGAILQPQPPPDVKLVNRTSDIAHLYYIGGREGEANPPRTGWPPLPDLKSGPP